MSDRKRITLADAYEQYMAASRNMKPLGRDHCHIDQGYAGPQFLFSQDGTFPKHLDSHNRPLRTVQKALGLLS